MDLQTIVPQRFLCVGWLQNFLRHWLHKMFNVQDGINHKCSPRSSWVSHVILNLFCTMLLFFNTCIQASFMVDQTVKMCQTNTSAKVTPSFSNRELILMGPELRGISWSSQFNNLVWINDSGAKVILCLPLMLIDPNSFFFSHTATLCVGLTGVRSQLKSP